MQKRKPRKPRVKGKRMHTYRVVVETVLTQSITVNAASRGNAEDLACEIADRHPEAWADWDIGVRDCTSVLMTDGSWEFCNALDADAGTVV